MTFKEEIKALRGRIAKAETERDTWRTSGMQEKYLEAYSAVEALELQLESLRRQGLQAFAKAEAVAPAPERDTDSAAERQRLMAELSINYDGRHYHYDRYRYDQLEDAVAYARLQRLRLPSGSEYATQAMPVPPMLEGHDEMQRALMSELDIVFHDGIYHLGEHRYDRLSDAVNYARLRRLPVRGLLVARQKVFASPGRRMLSEPHDVASQPGGRSFGECRVAGARAYGLPYFRSFQRRSLFLSEASPRSSMRARPSHSCEIKAAPGSRNKTPGPGATRKKSPSTTSTIPADSHATRLAGPRLLRWLYR